MYDIFVADILYRLPLSRSLCGLVAEWLPHYRGLSGLEIRQLEAIECQQAYVFFVKKVTILIIETV